MGKQLCGQRKRELAAIQKKPTQISWVGFVDYFADWANSLFNTGGRM